MWLGRMGMQGFKDLRSEGKPLVYMGLRLHQKMNLPPRSFIPGVGGRNPRLSELSLRRLQEDLTSILETDGKVQETVRVEVPNH